MVRNVRKADLGDYTCKVSNAVGSQDVNITLTFKPEPPVLQAPIERDGKYTITHWHIRSLLRLTEVMLKYRRKDVRFTFCFYFSKNTHIRFRFICGKLQGRRFYACEIEFSLRSLCKVFYELCAVCRPKLSNSVEKTPPFSPHRTENLPIWIRPEMTSFSIR